MKYCSWNNPGHNPYMGTLKDALDRVVTEPKVRQQIQYKMDRYQWDDLVIIHRDYIVGNYNYYNLRMMNFGNGEVCQQPSRNWWGNHQELGLVYCYDDACVVIPTVCRNLSLITRGPPTRVPGTTTELEIEGGTGTSFQQLVLENPGVNAIPNHHPTTPIPEVNTLWYLILGIVLIRIFTWKKKLGQPPNPHGYQTMSK